MAGARGGGGGCNGNGEFNGYRVSVLQDEKVLDLGYSYIYIYLRIT